MGCTERVAHAGPCNCILKTADFLSQIFLVFRWQNGLRKLLHQIIIVLLLFWKLHLTYHWNKIQLSHS